MATMPSQAGARRLRRRELTLEEALDHAVDIMTERGAGGLTVSEVARRMGVRGPSLYKYFPSLHAMYDALFARGMREQERSVRVAVDGHPPGVDRVRAMARAVVVWCVANPALAQLMFWRPVPGFEPSPEVFAMSTAQMDGAAAELAAAVARGVLAPEADSPDALRLLTVVLGGVISQQLANEPGVAFENGSFSRLTDEAIDMFLTRYRPEGADHADARP
jgi:AcrR family transcriptional regulator